MRGATEVAPRVLPGFLGRHPNRFEVGMGSNSGQKGAGMVKMLLVSVHGVNGRPVAMAYSIGIPEGYAIRRCYAYFIPHFS